MISYLRANSTKIGSLRLIIPTIHVILVACVLPPPPHCVCLCVFCFTAERSQSTASCSPPPPPPPRPVDMNLIFNHLRLCSHLVNRFYNSSSVRPPVSHQIGWTGNSPRTPQRVRRIGHNQLTASCVRHRILSVRAKPTPLSPLPGPLLVDFSFFVNYGKPGNREKVTTTTTTLLLWLL